MKHSATKRKKFLIKKAGNPQHNPQTTGVLSSEFIRQHTPLTSGPIVFSPNIPVRLGAFADDDFARKAEEMRTRVVHDLKGLPFPQVATQWLEEKQIYNRQSTLDCYRDYLKRLVTYFTMPLNDIHIGHIMEYQNRMRKHYHPDSVNHDINMLSQIMKKADLWGPIREHYRPLPRPDIDPPKVMSEYEEDRFFEFASRNEGSWLAYWVACFTNNTTASGKELRMLQLKDIEMEHDPPLFRVPKNMKNPNRPRTIPLNEKGAEIMGQLLRRARERGSTRPEHYLFAFRVKRNFFEPNRPASESWIKAQWKKLVDDAIAANIISFRIKPHNLRHQAITKLLDFGVPIETVREIAGHGVDSVITRHYYHGRVEKLRSALDLISPKKPVSVSNGKGKEEMA